MEEQLFVRWLDNGTGTFRPMSLRIENGVAVGMTPSQEQEGEPIYMSDGFIDSHAHVYDGATDLGFPVDEIGYKTGVHLVVDAGSAGAINYPCFYKYVLPSYKTPVKVFLNIGRAGLVSKQPYYDERLIDAAAVENCVAAYGRETIIGIKVLSSGLIVEHSGLKPMQIAAETAGKLGLPLMAHLVEGPPSNHETMQLMRKGDIITHCFHGAPNLEANRKASRGAPLRLEYCKLDNIMWNPDGTPVKALEEALMRGVRLDVGHGSGSFDQNIARPVIASGFYAFSISTDAHIRSVHSVVHSLPHVMSKFLALGMPLPDVVRSVTSIPAGNLGLEGWCGHPLERATLFRVRKTRESDPPFMDSNRVPMDVRQVIEPIAIIRGAEFVKLAAWEGE